MCGISGFNFKDETLVLKMNDVLRHRGPDGQGFFVDDGISLGHRRLSIIDLSDAAAQPMRSHDGRYVITYNGELYNFLELKGELNDYPYGTQSDTEVILASYEKWGKECVKRFNGIFAFAIWDCQRKELFVARDSMGVKPFYYYHDGRRFIFASEIKAIIEHDIPRTLDKEAFNLYLRLLYVPAPLTMFRGIRKLPPAHCGILRGSDLTLERYWDVSFGNYLADKREIQQRIVETLRGAVHRQMISDRPLGVYLSGGIDSSSIVAFATERNADIDTFSVGFDLTENEEVEKFNADFELARKTADYFGTNHHEVLISSKDVEQYFEKVVWHLDEPLSNPTELPRFKLAQFAKQRVAVALGGDGGDELFAGYHRYRYSYIADQYQRWVPSFLRSSLLTFHSLFRKLNTPYGIERLALFMFQDEGAIKEVVRPEMLDLDTSFAFMRKQFVDTASAHSFTESFPEIDRKSWLVDESLAQTDKMSMASGLEIRVPFLDKELVELSYRIALRHKLSMRDTKIILKEAMRDHLPAFLFSERKRGWVSPGAKWLRHPGIVSLSDEILSSSYNESMGDMFDWNAVRVMLHDHRGGKRYNLLVVWALLTFQSWAKIYKITL